MTPKHASVTRSDRRIKIWTGALAAGLLLGFTVGARGQSPRRLDPSRIRSQPRRMPAMRSGDTVSLYDIPLFEDRRTRDFSWMHIDPPRIRQIMVHDIITIIVDEKSEVTLRSGFDRQRTSNLKAELKEFMRIGKRGNLATAAPNQPTIDANLTGRSTNSGRATTQEGIRYRIAATVVDVLPNGTVVLEARKSIRTDHDIWQFSLTGLIRSADVRRDNTALSENIANLDIIKKRDGKVFDSVKRPWGVRLYDLFFPF